MADVPPSGLGPLLTPDGLTALALGIGGSFVTAFQEKVRGWGVLVSNIGAAMVTAAVLPIAVKQGYTWNDWLAATCVLTGATSSGVFALIFMIQRRVLAQGDAIADGLIARALAFLGIKGGDK